MTESQEVVKKVRAVLERESGINFYRNTVDLSFDGRTLVISGEVDSIGAKRKAYKLLSGLSYIPQIDDRLCVSPAARREDGEIRDSLIGAYTRESAFHNCNIHVLNKGQLELVRDVREMTGCTINFGIEDGVVTLSGEVISLSHKRLAGAIAWWIPGTRDVLNYLHVVPAEDDTDDEITDAVRMVLAKDPLVHADQIRVTTNNRTVVLEGLVPVAEEKKMAESDVWYLSGIDAVVNEINVGY